jgi:hypothetical protein
MCSGDHLGKCGMMAEVFQPVLCVEIIRLRCIVLSALCYGDSSFRECRNSMRCDEICAVFVYGAETIDETASRA